MVVLSSLMCCCENVYLARLLLNSNTAVMYILLAEMCATRSHVQRASPVYSLYGERLFTVENTPVNRTTRAEGRMRLERRGHRLLPQEENKAKLFRGCCRRILPTSNPHQLHVLRVYNTAYLPCFTLTL